MESLKKLTYKSNKKLGIIYNVESGLIIKSATEKVAIGRFDGSQVFVFDDRCMELCNEFNIKPDDKFIVKKEETDDEGDEGDESDGEGEANGGSKHMDTPPDNTPANPPNNPSENQESIFSPQPIIPEQPLATVLLSPPVSTGKSKWFQDFSSHFIENLRFMEDQFNSLNAELSTSNSELTRVNTELTRVNTELTHMKTDLTRVNTDLTRVNTELTRVNTELTRVNTELTQSTSELTNTKKKLASIVSALQN